MSGIHKSQRPVHLASIPRAISRKRLFFLTFVYLRLFSGLSVVMAAMPADTVAPQPGNAGLITYSITSTGATLSWTKATDNITPSSALAYEVRLSTINDIDSIAKAEAYGGIVKAYTQDINTTTVGGWQIGTTYYFTVIVKDEAGNKSPYRTVPITMTAPAPALPLAAPTPSPQSAPVKDTVAPVPGGGGGISGASVTSTSLTLNWTKGTDNANAPSQLLYEVRRSMSNNIDTVGRAEANGTIIQPYAANISTANVLSLNADTNYFFNVVVKDNAGNKAVYVTKNFTTAAAEDTAAPNPGGGGRITPSNVGTTTLTLNWIKATDNVSPPSQLQYEVRKSNANNIDSVMGSVVSGSIVQGYTPDISSVTVVGLSAGTTYYFNVVVKDTTGNRATYSTAAVTTAPVPDPLPPASSNPGKNRMTQATSSGDTATSKVDSPSAPRNTGMSSLDTTAPVPGGGGLIAISGNSPTGLTLRWKTATDDKTATAALQYKILRSPARNMNTVAEAETNGSVILNFTPDTSSYNVKSLKNAGQDFFTVIVKDEAGNKAVYATAGNLSERYTFLPNGGWSSATTSAPGSPLNVSQVLVLPAKGSAIPSGLAVIKSSAGNGVMSAAAMPLASAIRSGSLYVDLAPATKTSGAVRTGIALTNPSAQDAEISFLFTDANGMEIKTGSFSLAGNHQISTFLDESPFNGPGAFKGTFSFSATAPISGVGTRTVTPKNGESLLQALPFSLASNSGTSLLIPLFADGDGWSTEIVLTNPSQSLQTGTVEFWGQGTSGEPAPALKMTVNGVSGSTFNYSIPPRAVVQLATAGTAAAMNSGSVHITSDIISSQALPHALAIVSSRSGNTTNTETSVSALPTGTSFRAFVENQKSPEWVSSSVAIGNSSDGSNTLNLKLSKLDGTLVGLTSITLPPGGQVSKFITDLFPGLVQESFQGLIDIEASAPVAVAALRCMYNAAGKFMITSTPALNESAAVSRSSLTFPLVVTGAGFNTELILFGQSDSSGEGQLRYLSKDGLPQNSP